jgi:hypothetical protein
VRLVVSADHAAGRVRPGPHGQAAAGVDDGVRLFALVFGGVDPVLGGRGLVRRVVAADRAVGRGAQVLVWDGEGAIGRWRDLTPGLSGLPRHSGGEGAHVPAGRSGGQGAGRAVPRLSGAFVPARPYLHRPGGFQRPGLRRASSTTSSRRCRAPDNSSRATAKTASMATSHRYLPDDRSPEKHLFARTSSGRERRGVRARILAAMSEAERTLAQRLPVPAVVALWSAAR